MTQPSPDHQQPPGIAVAVVVRDGRVLTVRRRIAEGTALGDGAALGD
ncbi:hypothetical protein [Kitasatospora sp. NPDC089509]